MIPNAARIFAEPTPWVKAHLCEDFNLLDFPPGARVLDIGCGYGRNLERLLAAGCLADGVDVDPVGLAWCESQGWRVEQAGAEVLPFEDATFDGLVLDGVLQYTDRFKAMAEMARVLKPGGVLHLSTQGLGYGLHLLLDRKGLGRIFGLRVLLNGALLSLIGRGLPGWAGDTLAFRQGQFPALAKAGGLDLLRVTAGPTFGGLDVFLYATFRKPGLSA